MSPLEKEMSLLSTEEILSKLDSGALDPVKSAIVRRVLHERRNEPVLAENNKPFPYLKAIACVVAVFVLVSQFDVSDESSVERSNVESAGDGDHECVVMNLSRGNGPCNLECKKDGDEITIRFPNGGYVVVDESGYEASRSEQWSVQFND